jgi:hypothetical protein
MIRDHRLQIVLLLFYWHIFNIVIYILVYGLVHSNIYYQK